MASFLLKSERLKALELSKHGTRQEKIAFATSCVQEDPSLDVMA
jgi:hypothetical protein